MKKKNLLAFAAAATMLFAGCTDDGPDPDNGGGGSEMQGDAWMSLNIQMTNGITKALHDPNTENGTADETQVNEILVLFFDNHLSNDPDPKVVSRQLWDQTDPEAPKPGQPGGAASAPFKVAKESKAMLVILNPTTALKAFGVGDQYSMVNAAVTGKTVEDVIGAGKDNFMMTNAKGQLEPTTILDNGGNITVTDVDLKTYSTAQEADKNPYSLTVDRVAAKVRLYVLNDGKYVGNALDVATVGWTLNVTNKQYYPMSKRTPTWMESGNVADGARGAFISPYDKWKFGSYRRDPNYDGQKTKWTGDLTVNVSYNENYDYFTQAAPPASWIAPTQNPAGANEDKTVALYCLENTQEEADNYEAFTTHVLVKAVVVPNGLKLPNSSIVYDGPAYNDADATADGKVVANADWIKVGAGYYTYDLLIKYIEAELTAKYKDGSSDSYATPTTSTFSDYLGYLVTKSVPNVTAVTIPTKADFTTQYGTTDAEIEVGAKGIATKFKQAGVIAHGADYYGTTSYYKAGDSYYKIMIKHDNDLVNTNNKLGEFGVVRNSVYDIHIQSIMYPGYPRIPDPDPDTPDEQEESWIAVNIGINPWTWYTQNADL